MFDTGHFGQFPPLSPKNYSWVLVVFIYYLGVFTLDPRFKCDLHVCFSVELGATAESVTQSATWCDEEMDVLYSVTTQYDNVNEHVIENIVTSLEESGFKRSHMEVREYQLGILKT